MVKGVVFSGGCRYGSDPGVGDANVINRCVAGQESKFRGEEFKVKVINSGPLLFLIWNGIMSKPCRHSQNGKPKKNNGGFRNQSLEIVTIYSYIEF